MYQVIANILSNVSIITIKNKSLYEKRTERLNNAYAEANGNIPPTIDPKQRLHAPKDGYVIPSIQVNHCDFEEKYVDRLFGKGEYLPNPIREDQEFYFFHKTNKEFKHSTSIKLESEEFIELFKNIDLEDKPFSFKFSKSWTFNEEKNCYLTIHGAWKSVTEEFFFMHKEYTDIVKSEREEKREEERLRKLALKGIAPIGKDSINGTIISIKEKEGYMENSIVLKVLIELENKSTVYGNLPKSLYDAEKGSQVSFTATFNKASDTDNTHSFFKRPSKAKILETI